MTRGVGSSSTARGFGGAWDAEERGEGVLQGILSSGSAGFRGVVGGVLITIMISRPNRAKRLDACESKSDAKKIPEEKKRKEKNYLDKKFLSIPESVMNVASSPPAELRVYRILDPDNESDELN